MIARYGYNKKTLVQQLEFDGKEQEEPILAGIIPRDRHSLPRSQTIYGSLVETVGPYFQNYTKNTIQFSTLYRPALFPSMDAYEVKRCLTQ